MFELPFNPIEIVNGLMSKEFGAVMLLVFFVCEAIFSLEYFTNNWKNGFKHLTALAVGGLLGLVIAIPMPDSIPSFVGGLLAGGAVDRLVAKFKK